MNQSTLKTRYVTRDVLLCVFSKPYKVGYLTDSVSKLKNEKNGMLILTDDAHKQNHDDEHVFLLLNRLQILLMIITNERQQECS